MTIDYEERARTISALARFRNADQTNPEIRNSIAVLLEKNARECLEEGDVQSARGSLQEAVEIRVELAKTRDGVLCTKARHAIRDLAHLEIEHGDRLEALRLAETAVGIARDSRPRYSSGMGEALHLLGTCQFIQKQFHAAGLSLKRAFEYYSEEAAEAPGLYETERIEALIFCSMSFLNSGKDHEAVSFTREAISLHRLASRRNPNRVELQKYAEQLHVLRRLLAKSGLPV